MKIIAGFPTPSKEDLQYLAKSDFLNRSLLTKLGSTDRKQAPISSSSSVAGARVRVNSTDVLQSTKVVSPNPTIDLLAERCIGRFSELLDRDTRVTKDQIGSQVVFNIVREHFKAGPKSSNKRKRAVKGVLSVMR